MLRPDITQLWRSIVLALSMKYFVLKFTISSEGVLAGDQWWPRTSGGRLRLAHVTTHVLHHKFGRRAA